MFVEVWMNKLWLRPWESAMLVVGAEGVKDWKSQD